MTGFWTVPIQCSPTTAHVPSAQASGIPSTGTWPLRKLSSSWSLPTLNLDSFFQEKKDLIGTASSNQWLFSRWVDCIFTQPCTKWTEARAQSLGPTWAQLWTSCVGMAKKPEHFSYFFFPSIGDFYMWLALQVSYLWNRILYCNIKLISNCMKLVIHVIYKLY